MKAVPTAQDRVEEIVGSWQAEHRTALADLAQDRLELRSTLTGQADRQLVVGLAAQQLQSQADGLLTLAEAVRQAGALAWNQMSQVPTRDQEPATPPDDGSDGGGSNNGGGSNGGGSNGGGAGGGTQKPSGGSVTVTDSKTGATAQVTTGADGRVTAQVTVPAGVAHATLRIPCAGDTGTVAVLVGADGSRRVLPRSVYQDGILTVRVDGSATLELVDGSRQFADVSGGAWYADSVQFTASRELFSGVGGGRFAPAGTMTRSMLVTVLHRLEGAPAAAGGGFQDVPQDSWYSQAAHWAAEQSITDGTAAGRFEPDGLLTRESLAVMLHRAASRPGAAGEALEGFRGGRDTSDWAREAMAWACASGILTGDGSGGLQPRANITRAEAAAMLTRFVTQTTTA